MQEQVFIELRDWINDVLSPQALSEKHLEIFDDPVAFLECLDGFFYEAEDRLKKGDDFTRKTAEAVYNFCSTYIWDSKLLNTISSLLHCAPKECRFAFMELKPQSIEEFFDVMPGRGGVYRSFINAQEGMVITGCFINESVVRIPHIIDRKPVIGIAQDVFAGKEISKVYLPEWLWRIGASAFEETKLSSVCLPDSVQYIDHSAFCSCPIGHIVFSKNLIKIGDSAFSDCLLREIILPEGLIAIGQWAFRNCARLEYLRIPESITCFWDEESPSGDPECQSRLFGLLNYESWHDCDTFYGCTSLERIDFGYPADIDIVDGVRPLSRAALCQMFTKTPWLEKALNRFKQDKRCVKIEGVPCAIEEIFVFEETDGSIVLKSINPGLKSHEIKYCSIVSPVSFSGKKVIADENVFVTETTESEWMQIKIK